MAKTKSKSHHPEIVELTVDMAKKRGGNQLITDANWVTQTLFRFQNGATPLTDAEADCVRLAESLRPRYEWQVTRDHVRIAEQNKVKKGWK